MGRMSEVWFLIGVGFDMSGVQEEVDDLRQLVFGHLIETLFQIDCEVEVLHGWILSEIASLFFPDLVDIQILHELS